MQPAQTDVLKSGQGFWNIRRVLGEIRLAGKVKCDVQFGLGASTTSASGTKLWTVLVEPGVTSMGPQMARGFAFPDLESIGPLMTRIGRIKTDFLCFVYGKTAHLARTSRSEKSALICRHHARQIRFYPSNPRHPYSHCSYVGKSKSVSSGLPLTSRSEKSASAVPLTLQIRL